MVNLMHAMGMTDRNVFGVEEVEFQEEIISLRGPLPRLT